MELATYANLLYGAYHGRLSDKYVWTTEQREKLEALSREDFVADMLKTNRERWASEDGAAARLFAGSSERAKLSDTEITALANKYDLRSLDRKSYDSFLDDLTDMGAISEWEKGCLGYNGLVMFGYYDADGSLVTTSMGAGLSSCAEPNDSKSDLAAWLSERVKWTAEALASGKGTWDNSNKWEAQQENEMFTAVNSIVNRVLAAKGDSGEAEQEKADIIELILDSNSSLYEEMYTKMKLQLEQSEEEKRKQAIIDALDAILQSISAKKDEQWKRTPDSVSSMAELSGVIDSLDKDDPRKEQLDLLRQQMQNLGIYIDLDVGVKGKDQNSWGTTLTQQLIQKEKKNTEPSIFDII